MGEMGGFVLTESAAKLLEASPVDQSRVEESARMNSAGTVGSSPTDPQRITYIVRAIAFCVGTAASVLFSDTTVSSIS